jgi:hypothetical protein
VEDITGWSEYTSKNSTPRKINISELEWTMTGSTLKTDAGWLTIKIPELWPSMPRQIDQNDLGYKRLKTALISGDVINKQNAEKIYWRALTEEEIGFLKTHFQ